MRRLEKFLKQDIKRRVDYVIVQKSMGKRHVPKRIRELQKGLVENSTLIWDFDDYILQGGEILQEEYDLYCANAKHIIVTSNYLKDTLPQKCQGKVILLPTTDMQMPITEEKLTMTNDKRKRSMSQTVDLVWVATSGNIPHLEVILPILDETAKEIQEKYHKALVLNVVCDKKVKGNYTYLKIKNIKWTRRRAIHEIRKGSIGLMPLTDSEYARGKGGFKLIQYISTGLPVIASDVGYNAGIFQDDIGYLVQDKENKEPWKKAILALIASEKEWEECSKKAYEVWNHHFHYETNLKVWKELLS